MHTSLVDRFCTPPFLPVTDFDYKVLAGATKTDHPFEKTKLTCYSWGAGKTILLVHGWGSRASHLSMIGRILSISGFRVVAFDAPAHKSLRENVKAETSNFFEFSRAIISLSKTIGPFYAIVGHSLGAIASLFAVAGYSLSAGNKASTEKLVLISLPVSIESMVLHFCLHHGLNADDQLKLKEGLEKTFNFSMREFSAVSALRNIDADTLLVHDSEDDEFPVTDIYDLHKACPKTDIYTTQGTGHHKILKSGQMIVKIRQYLTT